MKIGDKYHGRITGVQSYGAFAELENGVTGLIHISEVKTGFVEDIHQLLHVGQEVLVQVVDVDEFTQKASLSLRSLEEAKNRQARRRRFTNERFKIGFQPLADALPDWIQEGKQQLQTKNPEETR